MPTATFVLSTGRCGTQWLARALGTILGESAVVEHEPIGNDFAPRQMLALGDPALIPDARRSVVLQHLERIDTILESADYVDCGHPLWSALPYLLRRLEGRVRVIHLVRHPVPTAASWVTQQAWCPPLVPHMPEKVLLAATDPGVRHPEYAARWPGLTPHEKALYYWLEVNALGVALEGSVPWLRIRYEDLFAEGGGGEILPFVGAPEGASLEPFKRRFVDRVHFISDLAWDPAQIDAHPAVVDLARRFGYDPHEWNAEKLWGTYSRRERLPSE